jgi:hypothetical protein
MEYILKDIKGYRIYYIHQTDTRGFNRGAMKNIGFRMVQDKWPKHYKNITLVFNDIDSMPKTPGQLNYATTHGKVKHFYGFKYTLGGIVSITAQDFENINGFPNFWAWGYEDNMLQTRALNAGLTIDRSTFFPISDPSILRLSQNNIRPVNRGEFNRYMNATKEGISYIHNLEYSIHEDTGFIDVHTFSTGLEEEKEKTVDYDLRNGPAPFKNQNHPRKRATMPMFM